MLTDFGTHPADRVTKAELHAHLEGTIHPPVLRMLAERAQFFPMLGVGCPVPDRTEADPMGDSAARVARAGAPVDAPAEAPAELQ